MDQFDLTQQIKETLLNFPNFLQDVLKKPLIYVEQEVGISWLAILIYVFLAHAASGFFITIFSFHFTGIFNVLIFSPFQALIILGVISFVIQFILEKIGLAHITFSQVYKLMAIIDIMITAFVLPFLLIASLFKSAELNYLIHAASVIGEAFLVYRGFKKQFLVPEKKALGIVSIFSALFLIPIVSGYINGYPARQEAKRAKMIHAQHMKKSVEEIEKELNQSAD